MTTDQQAQDEIGRWGGEFIGAIDAIHEGEPEDVIRVRLLGDPDQDDEALNYRIWMMLPVGAWVAGQLLERSSPEVDGSGFFGPQFEAGHEPAERTAAQMVAAAANGADDQVMALFHAHREEHGWLGLAETLGALAVIAAPMWDRKPVDL